MQLIRRLLLGTIIGFVMAGLLIVFVQIAFTISGDGISAAQLGGSVRFAIAGVFIGASYAWLFHQPRSVAAENLMNGFVVALATWVIVTVNIIPGLIGQGPMWDAANAATLFPALLALILHGGFTGLVYGAISESFADILALNEPAAVTAEPEITTRVVVLGGGYAGVYAAQTLERELVDNPNVGIWLVSGANHLLHTPMMSEVSASAVDAQHISPVLRNFFQRVQVVQGMVDRVDLDRKIVHLAPSTGSSRRDLAFDHLILTPGGVPNYFGNAEVEAEAFSFKSLEDAVALRNQVIDMFEQADFEPDEARRRQMMTFVVAGGGFAGVELIGGLNDLARGIAAYYPNISPDELRVILVHSRDTILPELSPSLGKYAQEKLEERGVEFILGTRVTGAKPGTVELGNEDIPTKTFIWTAGNKPSPILETLGLPLTSRGQIEVDAELRVPDVSGLWAAGDSAQVPDLTTGKYCPPTAQHALREGKTAGYNVAASIKGKPLKPFKFKMLGSLAALGHQLAVAEIMGLRFSGFLAWLMWRGIYLSKLPTFDKQVRVGLDWVLDVFFPPDIVQLTDVSRTSPELPEQELSPTVNGTVEAK